LSVINILHPGWSSTFIFFSFSFVVSFFFLYFWFLV